MVAYSNKSWYLFDYEFDWTSLAIGISFDIAPDHKHFGLGFHLIPLTIWIGYLCD